MTIDPMLAWTILIAVVAAAIAWGKTSADVSSLKKSVSRIEKQLFGME